VPALFLLRVMTEVIEVIEDTNKSNGWVAPGKFFNGTHYLLHYSESNDHPDEIVVCVHGIGSYHNTFTRLDVALLSKGYNVLQFDLIGRGYSEPSKNGKYGREEHIQQMHSLLDHLQLLRPKHLHIIGHSMGGCLSTLFTSEYGEYVKSLTLIAPAGLLGYFPIEFMKSWCPCLHGVIRNMLANRENSRKAWRDDFFSHEGESLALENEWVQELDAMNDNNPHAFEAFWKSVLEFPMTNIREDIIKVASDNDLPIMILWGKKDKACSYSNLAQWESIISSTRKNGNKNLTIKSYESAAHGVLSERHEEVHLEILKFLTGSNGDGDMAVSALSTDVEVHLT
jgi:pimeloyl-ACP methyl ester carboxylesterase